MVYGRHQHHGLAYGGPGDTQRKGEFFCLICLKTSRRMDVLFEDQMRCFSRHLLDLHAAGGTGHHDGPPCSAVKHKA
jgi:hypothetical protein